jgi:transposase-like protein
MKQGKSNVATFSDHDKAERAKNRLVKAGIAAEVVDESHLQRLWFGSKPLANQKVYVPEEDNNRALETLQQADAESNILCGEVRCPKCGSAKVEYPQFTRKFIMTTFVEILCFLGVIDKRFYCEACHYTWPNEEKLRRSTDVMGWPTHSSAQRLVKKETQ